MRVVVCAGRVCVFAQLRGVERLVGVERVYGGGERERVLVLLGLVLVDYLEPLVVVHREFALQKKKQQKVTTTQSICGVSCMIRKKKKNELKNDQFKSTRASDSKPRATRGCASRIDAAKRKQHKKYVWCELYVMKDLQKKKKKRS